MQSGGSILEMKNEDHSHSACMVDEYFARSRSSKFSIFTQQDSRSKQFLDRLKNNFWGGDFDIQTWLLRCGCRFKIFRSQSSQTGYCDSASIKGRLVMQKNRVKKPYKCNNTMSKIPYSPNILKF